MGLHPSLFTTRSVKIGKSLHCSESPHLKMGIIIHHVHHCDQEQMARMKVLVKMESPKVNLT